MTALWWLIPSALVSGVGLVVLCLCRAAGMVRPLPDEETDQGFSGASTSATSSANRSATRSGTNPASSNGNPAAGGSEAAPSSGPISQPVSLLRVIQGGKS